MVMVGDCFRSSDGTCGLCEIYYRAMGYLYKAILQQVSMSWEKFLVAGVWVCWRFIMFRLNASGTKLTCTYQNETFKIL